MESGTEKPYKDLTLREVDVVDLVANGYSNREIANELCITEDTVKTHIFRTLRKLNAHDRGHAAVLALKHEIISLDDIDIPEKRKD